jgi:hypothetical protein
MGSEAGVIANGRPTRYRVGVLTSWDRCMCVRGATHPLSRGGTDILAFIRFSRGIATILNDLVQLGAAGDQGYD